MTFPQAQQDEVTSLKHDLALAAAAGAAHEHRADDSARQLEFATLLRSDAEHASEARYQALAASLLEAFFFVCVLVLWVCVGGWMDGWVVGWIGVSE